jgi:hypothetical protein
MTILTAGFRTYAKLEARLRTLGLLEPTTTS